MRVYLLVLLLAAAVTYIVTPLVRLLARRIGAVTAVRERDVHTVPTPRLGGVAMLLGFAVSIFIASHVPFLDDVFATFQPWAVLLGATLVVILGVVDDVWDLDWLTKLVGQILAAGVIAWQGVQLITFPIGGLTIGSARLSLVATVLVVVVAINAVNFVDGLDGLAAGLIGIGGLAFFAYTYMLSRAETPGDYSNVASLIIVAVVGVCFGFLPHNFNPASIFMGDSGSMFLGITVAAATITVTGQIDPARLSAEQVLPVFVPILLPVAVILLPLLDMTLAVLRRLKAGTSPFKADRMHLHHRLLALGHSHRRAVLVLYMWTAVVAFGAAALSVFDTVPVLIGATAAVVVALILTLTHLPGLRRRPGRDTRASTSSAAAGPPRGSAAVEAPPATPASTSSPTSNPPKETPR